MLLLFAVGIYTDANVLLRCEQWCDADVKSATMPVPTSHIASSLQSVAELQQQQQQQQQQQSTTRPMNGLAEDNVVQPRHAAYGQ